MMAKMLVHNLDNNELRHSPPFHILPSSSWDIDNPSQFIAIAVFCVEKKKLILHSGRGRFYIVQQKEKGICLFIGIYAII